MKQHKLNGIALLICVCVVSDARAQYHTPIGIGNYGGVHSLYFNPSMHSSSAYLWQVNLAGIWGNVNNNYVQLRLPYSAYRIPNRIPLMYQTESGNPQFKEEWLRENLNGSPKRVQVSSDVYGPAASVKIKSYRLGIFTHAAANIRVIGISENFAHALFNGLDSAKGAFSMFDLSSTGTNRLKAFNITANTRAEIGVNLARSFKLDYNRQLSLGMSVKKVMGFQGFHFNSTDLIVNSIDKNNLYVHPGSMHLVTYGEKPGNGMGVDLGATYVFHKKDNKRNGQYAKSRTKYFSKLGFSLMDIGSINYKDAVFRDAVIQNGGANIQTSGDKYSNVTNYEQAIDEFMKEFATYRERNGNYKVGLPTRMVISSDFQVKKRMFVGTMLTQSLRSAKSHNARYQSFMMVAPRLEWRYFEVSTPLLLEYDYRSFRMGASFRVGPLYFGTNSLIGFLQTKRIKDADVYLGIAFGNLESFSFSKQVRKKLKSVIKPKKTSCFSF